ncbi:hypothetical protein CFP56_011753 [Quercus suber]|uniref:DC1 domain-containing protein n=1 Tax=Quercus suber TaxID=58331 RepID=A0AAW0KWN9_QUESU
MKNATDSFFINLVLITQKSKTPTSSTLTHPLPKPQPQSTVTVTFNLSVELVGVKAVDSTIRVRHAGIGFSLDVSCSLILDILTHPESKHNCSCCDSKISPIFRCTTCEFALDFKCATLPQTARYKQHDHPFTLRYTAEDDSGEYYCDICEEERNLKHWFYYCANCDYPAHTKCILGENSNVKGLHHDSLAY